MSNGRLLRTRHGREHSRVTPAELFFDLVFVFAVTRLSHGLLEHLTPLGLLQTTLLMMAVWWVWIYTTWLTNWLDPDRHEVRLLLFVLMLVGILLSVAIPGAYDGLGLLFAGCYVAMQLGRSLFMVWAVRGDPPLRRTFQGISVWFAVAGVLWIAGGLSTDGARLALWIAALAIEYLGPAATFWTPLLGRATTHDWNVEGGHLAERCGLFVIIALGESILVTGATFGGLAWTPQTVAAFLVAFVGSVAMWWIYFNVAAEDAREMIASSDDPGRMARSAYTYLHLPIVAGIIVAAVGDELVLAHPAGRLGTPTALAIVGGPILFVLGVLLFKWNVWGVISHRRVLALVTLAALIPLAPFLTPLAYAACAAAVLVALGAWESVVLHREAKAKATVAGELAS